MVTSFSLMFFSNKLDSAFIWNQRLFIKIYTCTWRLKGTMRLIETWLLFGHLQYVDNGLVNGCWLNTKLMSYFNLCSEYLILFEVQRSYTYYRIDYTKDRYFFFAWDTQADVDTGLLYQPIHQNSGMVNLTCFHTNILIRLFFSSSLLESYYILKRRSTMTPSCSVSDGTAEPRRVPLTCCFSTTSDSWAHTQGSWLLLGNKSPQVSLQEMEV